MKNSSGRATRPWPRAASDSKTLPDAGEENNCNEIATITSDDDPGAFGRSAKGVFT